jgi:hypothetical protein
MKCLVCGNDLLPQSRFCPDCGTAVSEAPTPASTPATSQGAGTSTPRQPETVHTVPPAQRAQTAFMGRYGTGQPALPTPSSLTFTPGNQGNTISTAVAAPLADTNQPPSAAPAPTNPESAATSATSISALAETPTQENSLLPPAPPPLPTLSPGTPSEAAPIVIPPTRKPAPLRRVLESPLAGRLIALVASLLLIALLAELGTFGYRVYKKNLADQQATATTQAALHATATGVAQATATARVVLLNDPLTTDTNGWAESKSSAFFQDGQYHLHNTDPNKTLNSYYEGRVFDDLKAQITITFLSNASPNAGAPYAAGLVLRADPTTPGNKYVFFISPDGTYNFARHDESSFYNNGWTDLTETPFASSSTIHTGKGATNTLTVIARGSTFTLFINGQQVEQVSDQSNPFTSGWIGLMVEGADMEASFSNLLVYGPDA